MLSAAFSPDGRWITFSRADAEREPDIHVMRADGSDPRRIIDDPAWESRPAWGP